MPETVEIIETLQQLFDVFGKLEQQLVGKIDKEDHENLAVSLAEVKIELEMTKHEKQGIEQTHMQTQAEVEQLRREKGILNEIIASMVSPEQQQLKLLKQQHDQLTELQDRSQRLQEVLRSSWTCTLNPNDFDFLGGTSLVSGIQPIRPPFEELQRIDFYTPDMADWFVDLPLETGVALITNPEKIMSDGTEWTAAWLSWMIRAVPRLDIQ